jgi:hypothetical protein
MTTRGYPLDANLPSAGSLPKKREFENPFKLMFAIHPSHKNMRLRRRANQWFLFARPAPDQEGRFAIVTNGMRWTWMTSPDERRHRGRRSRVVLTPRRWRQLGDDAAHRTGDGDKKPGSPGRARRKPLKPLRGECRVIPV